MKKYYCTGLKLCSTVSTHTSSGPTKR